MNLRPLAISLCCIVTFSRCAGTETDNPVTETRVPEYRSPVRFEPEPDMPTPCAPPSDDQPPPELALWGSIGSHLVGVHEYGMPQGNGIVVVDVGDPAAPVVIAELALEGRPRQLRVDGDSVTLLMDELPLFAGGSIPEPAALAAQTKLVRFNLSQPEAPMRVAEQVLEGEVWQMLARDGALWVLSARIDPSTLRCDVERNHCGYVSREVMIASRYEWSGASFVTSESVELPAGQRVWLTEGGLATAVGGDDEGATLHFAAFASDGRLLPPRTVDLGSPVVQRSPLYLAADRIGVFVYDLTDGTAALSVSDLDGNELAHVDGLSQGLGEGTRFVGDAALVSSGDVRTPATFIDFSDIADVRHLTLSGASTLVPLDAPDAAPTRALGWITDMNRNAVQFTLWALEAESPRLLDELSAPGLTSWSPTVVQVDGSRVLFWQREAGTTLTSVSHDGDELSLDGSVDGYADGGHANQLIGVADWVYASDGSFANPQEDAAARPIRDIDVAIAAVPLAGGQARLLRTSDGEGRLDFVLGDVIESIPVPSSAQRLLPAGDRVIVVDEEVFTQSLLVVALDPLRIVSELPLPGVELPPLGRASSVQETFSFHDEGAISPVRLDDQRWLLESELRLTCGSPEDCHALGIATGPEVRRRVFYVLDAASASIGEPLVLDVERGTPYELWSRPFVEAGTLLDLHLDPPYRGAFGAPLQSTAAFWLERYELDDAGALQALPLLNIPGYPIALLPDGSLLSVEASPATDATAKLYHSQLRGESVEVLAQRSVGGRFGSAKVVGQTLLYIRFSSDACDPVTQLETYALDAELKPLGALELPGDGWRILGATGAESVLLALPDNRSFARVTIDEQGIPVLESFATAPGHVESASVVEPGDSPLSMSMGTSLGTSIGKGAVLGVSEGAVVQVSP